LSFEAKMQLSSSIEALTKGHGTVLRGPRVGFLLLMGAIVVLGLCAFVLRDSFIPGVGMPGAAAMSDAWIIAGLAEMIPVSSSVAAMSLMIKDR
jgi:hypothetical protein